jgi:hypothetical protein
MELVLDKETRLAGENHDLKLHYSIGWPISRSFAAAGVKISIA